MVPIRKGDGTGLAAKGYSQIRKGDGTVLWNAIPDSGLLHNWDVDASASTTSVADQSGSMDLSGSVSSIQTDELDGNDAARHDRSQGDFFDASRGSTFSPPFTVFMVARMRQNISDTNQVLHDVSDAGDTMRLMEPNTNEYNIFDGTTATTGSQMDTNWHLMDYNVAGDGSMTFSVDDVVDISASLSANGIEGITVGKRAGVSERFADLDWTQITYYDADDADYSRSDVISYISERYPSLSI